MALFDDVMKLINAGYGKEEIDKMLAGEPSPAPEAAKPGASAQEASKPEGNPEPSPEIEALKTEIQNLTTTIAAMQAAAVKSAEQPQGKEPTAFDVVQGFFGEKGA